MEIKSCGTHRGLQGRVQQLLDCDQCSKLTDRKSCELLTSAPTDLADYTILGYIWLSDLLQSELK